MRGPESKRHDAPGGAENRENGRPRNAASDMRYGRHAFTIPIWRRWRNGQVFHQRTFQTLPPIGQWVIQKHHYPYREGLTFRLRPGLDR